MNKCGFTGRMGKDPKFYPGQQGGKKALMTFSLAVKRPGGQKDQQGNVITDWHDFTAFGKTAELLNQYCPTGTLVSVTDCVAVKETFTDKNSQQRTVTKFLVHEIDLEVTFAASKGNSNGNNVNSNNGGSYNNNSYNNNAGNQFSQGRQSAPPAVPEYAPAVGDELPF